MIDQVFQAEINKNLDDQQNRPGPTVAPALATFKNFGGGLGGFIGGPLQAGAAWSDILQGDSQILTATGADSAGGMFSTLSPKEQAESDAMRTKLALTGPDMNSPTGAALRTKAKDFMPDPQATGKAGVILGGLTSFASQAVPSALAGPPGLVALATERGVQKSDELQQQGVDLPTRTAAGIVSGTADAASMLLPMSGPTRLIAAGKGAVGGVTTSVIQTEAEKLILQHAGYDKLASTYDPFDPVSLALSAIVPAGFGALHGAHGAAPEGGGADVPTSDGTNSPNAPADQAARLAENVASIKAEMARPGVTPENLKILQAELDKQTPATQGHQPLDPDVDTAARVIQTADAIDASRLTPDDDLVGHENHVQAIETASDQIARGDAVDVSDIVGSDQPDTARVNAMRDRLNDTSSMLPAADDEHIAKLAPEAQDQLHGMYAAAAREKSGFDAELGQLADSVGGKMMAAPLKGTERATAKIASDYNGVPGRIKDLLRATIEVHSAEAASHVIARIRERYGITGERNLLDPAHTPIDGYRDAKFNVDVNGHIAEIQVNVPQMTAAKKIAHGFYEQREALSREAQGRTFTSDEQAKFDDLNAKMRAVYEPAWAEATMPRKADSEIGMPLRRIESEGNGRGEGGSQATQSDGPAPALNDTGTPSTSKNSARGENLAGSESGSRDIGTSNESLHLDAVASAADEILRTNPDLMVQMDGMSAPMRAADLLAAVRESAAEDVRDGSFLEIAAQCAISL